MCSGPFKMSRARAMAGFATDVDLTPLGPEPIRVRIVVFPQVGGVTIRAHEVPVLRRAGPVQFVVVRDPVLGIEVKPALAAGILRPRVPRDR